MAALKLRDQPPLVSSNFFCMEGGSFPCRQNERTDSVRKECLSLKRSLYYQGSGDLAAFCRPFEAVAAVTWPQAALSSTQKTLETLPAGSRRHLGCPSASRVLFQAEATKGELNVGRAQMLGKGGLLWMWRLSPLSAARGRGPQRMWKNRLTLASTAAKPQI